MSAVLKRVEAWPIAFGGEEHSGWLPPGAAKPLPTPVEHELLDVWIEDIGDGYLLIWAARPSPTCTEMVPPKTGDTWHQTVADAEAAALGYFGIAAGDWTDVRNVD